MGKELGSIDIQNLLVVSCHWADFPCLFLVGGRHMELGDISLD